MGQSNVGIRLSIDAAQAKSQVEDLSASISDLNKKIKELEAAGEWREAAQLYQAMNSAASARGQIMQQSRQIQPQAAQNMGMLNSLNDKVFGGQGAWILQNALNQITTGIIRSMDTALTAARQRASGDYAGAAVSEVRARGEIAGQGVGAGIGAGAGIALTAVTGQAWLIPLLAGLGGELGKFIGSIGSKKLEEDLAYSDQYKKAFASIDSLNQLYGGAINRKTGEENNRYGLQMYGRAAAATAGTGLSTQQFIQAMKETGGYGVKSETQALNMAHNQALWSRFTGTDISAIQKYAGQAYRYGGDSGAVSTAYGGLMAQDMGKGQFAEFLNSMARIMEDGIAKGFVRSSEEIAGNMAMLYRLFGASPLWQGEQGAQRLSQMNNAVSNATNLQSVEDVISFGAARDILNSYETPEARRRFMEVGRNGQETGRKYTGTYVDYMQLLEGGITPELLKGQWSAVNKLDGDNIAAMIERFRTMYGLNYHGGAQVWAMFDNAWDSEKKDWKAGYSSESLAREIETYKTTPKYQSDSEKLQTALNALNNNLVSIGQFKFNETEWGVLQKQQQDVASILEKLREDEARRNAARDAPPVNVPSQAVPTVSTANGGGPAGTLQLFQGGQRFTNYMMTGLTDFQMLYGDMVSYKDRERGTDYGEYIARRMGNALEGLDFDALNPTQDRVLGIGLENLVMDFNRYKGGGITEREYTDHFERQLQQLTSAIESMKNAVERLERDGIQVSGEIHAEMDL